MEPLAPSRQICGQAAEDAACHYLIQQGFHPVCRNFRSRRGEVDLVVVRATCWSLWKSAIALATDFGGAIASVTRGKQQKIIAAARYFLHHRPRFRESCRQVRRDRHEREPRKLDVPVDSGRLSCRVSPIHD
jgi:putative endonuclease